MAQQGNTLKDIKIIWITVVVLLCGLIMPPHTYSMSDSSGYLVALFGLPDRDLGLLRESGLNAIFLRSHEVEKAKALALKKIYVVGATARAINRGLDWVELDKKFSLFKEAGAPFDYYVGDDLKCRHVATADKIRKRYGIKKGIIGVIAPKRCFDDFDVFTYYYPLMRRRVALREILQKQVEERDRHKRFQGNKFYLFIQAHPQNWYREAVRVTGANLDALLYPDGQVCRMLIYYGIATGADGYCLYDNGGFSEPTSEERVLAEAQTILETRKLYPVLLDAKGVSFFERSKGIYGTVVKGSTCDVFFLFSSDEHTVYHPSTRSNRVKLDDVVNRGRYKEVLQYLPLSTISAPDEMDLRQDKPVILLGVHKGFDKTKLLYNQTEVSLYLRILRQRADTLAKNIKRHGVSVPVEDLSSSDSKDETLKLLKYVDRLNELKRDAWLENVKGGMPVDGDELNAEYFKSKRKNRRVNLKENRDDFQGKEFNFYFNYH